jgi:hypothetical protein
MHACQLLAAPPLLCHLTMFWPILLLLLLRCQVFTFRDMSHGVKSNVKSIAARGGRVRQLAT